MSAGRRLGGATVAVAFALVLGVLAAWPVYHSWWLILPAGAAFVIGCGLAAIAMYRRWSTLTTVIVLFALFVLTVAPVAVPSSFQQLPFGPLRGVVDGLAAIVLGWKQLLTLSLPVGTYQTMMVPAYVVFLLTAFLTCWIAVRGGRLASFAAFPMLAPVAFGTVFGSSLVSTPLHLGPVTISAPREVGLWVAAALLGVLWVVFAAGAERRAALRLGRAGSSTVARGRMTRALVGAATLVVAMIAAVACAPLLDSAIGGSREVARDAIDPELVIREQTSPLAKYRAYKQDDAIDVPLLIVDSRNELPSRLRLAVLDDYDGVDFHVSEGEAGRFSRFPTGDRVADPTQVSVRIEEGYGGIWVPAAWLGSSPDFSGPRADDLADSFYVNRATGAAIAVPGAGTGSEPVGLAEGDAYRAVMSGAPDGELTGRPASRPPAFDVDAMPELTTWVEAQNQPATGEGLVELIQRLRDRGYLSHALSDGVGSQVWLARLAEQYGTRFEPSAGGHSTARIEQIFAQLNTQQRLAGDEAADVALVAAIGDDEQFATAAALVARAVGFNSRVVVGMHLGDADAGVPGVPACFDTCTGQHLAAWVEVEGSDGWVPLDVTPQVMTPPVTLDEGAQLPEFATTPEERDAREVEPPLGLGEQNDDAQAAEEQEGSAWIWPVIRVVGLSLAALILLGLPLLFLPFAKRRRSKKRQSQVDPELRALGAWNEMVDRAVDSGKVVPRGASRNEIAEIIGTAPARWAAGQVDRAVFSPSGIDAGTADWLWAANAADREAQSATLTRGQRLRQKYTLRSYGVRGRARRSDTEESATIDQADTAGSHERVE